MDKAELDDLKDRAKNHFGKQALVKILIKGKNEKINYVFFDFGNILGNGEGDKIVYNIVKGQLRSPEGKIISRPLKKIVNYFETGKGTL